MKNIFIAAFVLMTANVGYGQNTPYVSVRSKSVELVRQYKQVVVFREDFVYSPTNKLWLGKNGERYTPSELLKNKKIELQNVHTTKLKGPFIHVWDQGVIRIIFTGGCNMGHRAVKTDPLDRSIKLDPPRTFLASKTK